MWTSSTSSRYGLRSILAGLWRSVLRLVLAVHLALAWLRSSAMDLQRGRPVFQGLAVASLRQAGVLQGLAPRRLLARRSSSVTAVLRGHARLPGSVSQQPHRRDRVAEQGQQLPPRWCQRFLRVARRACRQCPGLVRAWLQVLEPQTVRVRCLWLVLAWFSVLVLLRERALLLPLVLEFFPQSAVQRGLHRCWRLVIHRRSVLGLPPGPAKSLRLASM